MQVKEKAGQTLTEPITASGFRSYIGLTDTTQDTYIGTLIKAARIWLENYTGRSLISKSYQVEFENEDGVDNWYALPFTPCTSITSVQINDTDIDYYSKGLKGIEVYPLSAISTGTSDNTLDVEFVAGASDDIAIQCLYRVVSDLYNVKYDAQGGAQTLITWDTMRFVEQLIEFEL